ncbi:hypothetical protein BOTBODRAFT_205002 [Botryobasidium botryosum FD-172 SS1]|uniref:Uncharacterized protein n=1 Tax=Botryobasidium botryosum (strain FD-172 SS1) TaxID=930990 RepID=A0A067N3F1_BOTB1|nr:hypothetical protein BOTBODRAFT_205002 [Botryobasidium botryosum FD-172 SS1]
MEFAIEQLIADSFITGTWLNTGGEYTPDCARRFVCAHNLNLLQLVDQALEASKRALSVLSVSEEKQNEDRATQAAQPKTSPYCEKESAEKGTDALGEN